MIKFFRHIRKKLLGENRFTKYLVYAIGEIVLVVIGIMIALQVNNWNNRRAQDEKTVAILNQIIDELIIDVDVIQDANEYYLFKDSLIEVYKKIDLKNIPSNSETEFDEQNLIHLIRTFAPVEIHDRGFNLLMNHTDQLDKRFKKHVDMLVYLYQDQKPMIELYYDRLKTLLYEHRMHKIKNHSWYARMNETNKTDPKEYEYYKFDPIYKNYVRFYNEMIYNIIINSRLFEDYAIKFCFKVNDEYKLGRNLENEFSFQNPSKELLTSLSGKYLTTNKDTLTFIEKNSQLHENTYDNQNFTYVFEKGKKVGLLRYLGNNTFYRNHRENLRVNKDGSISIVRIASNNSFPLTRINND